MSIDTTMLVRGKNEFGATVREVQGQVRTLEASAKTVGGSLGGSLGATIAGGVGALAVGAIIDTGVELAKLGGQAMRVESGFEELFGSVGAGAEDALGKLRAASQGSINDTQLMLSANRASMLQVSSDADTIAKLLEAAAGRGRKLGVDTAQAFDNIVVGIGRMSPLILDNLGILTGGEKAFEAYAQTLGKTAEQLTDTEKRQFLINKVLADAVPLANDAAAGFERFAATQENLRTEFGKSIAAFANFSGITSSLDKLATDMSVGAAANAARAAQGIGLMDVAVAQLKADLGIATTTGETYSNMLQGIVEAQAAGTISAAQAKEQIKQLTEAFFGVAGSTSDAARGMYEVSTASVVMAGNISVARYELGTLGSAAGVASDQLRGLPAAMAGWTDAVAKARDAARSSALAKVGDLGVEGARNLAKIRTTEVEELAYALGTAEASAEETEFAFAGLKAEWREQDTVVRSAAAGVDTYNESLNQLRGSIESAIGSAISGTKSLVDLGSEGMVGGFDPNGAAANFGRMWDVAKNGFQSQWLEPLRAAGLIPADVIAGGEEALKRFAESKARAFQAGTDLGLLDKDKIKAQVMAQIAAEAELAKVRDQILAELSGAGVNKTAASGALDTVLGQSGMTSTGQAGAVGYTEGFTASMAGQGAKIVTALSTEIEANTTGFEGAGRSAGTMWGSAFLAIVGENVPPQLVALLVSLVTPGVMERIARDQGRGGPVK